MQVYVYYLPRLLFFALSQTRRGGINVRIRDYLTGGQEDSAFPQSKAKLVKGLKYLHLFKLISNCRNEQVIYSAALKNTLNIL